MFRTGAALLGAAAALICGPAAAGPNGTTALSDAAIRHQLMDESLAAYRGQCPCPENIMRNGRRCGKNSAWSKPGGRQPLCYPSDVTPEMIETWRQSH